MHSRFVAWRARFGAWRSRIIALDTIDPALLLGKDRPYLALLAVASRAYSPDAQAVAEAAVELTLARLPEPLAAEQLDAILGMVDAALRVYLEDRIMEHRQYQFQSPLFRGILKKGESEGKAKGKVAGKAQGMAESILAFLAARGIPVSETVRARILGCTDADTLDTWIRRAAVASTAAAVVRTTPAPRAPASTSARRTRTA